MGTKPCKPVVPYEEAKEKLSGPDFEHLKRVFFSVVRAPSLESTLAKDDLRAWVRRFAPSPHRPRRGFTARSVPFWAPTMKHVVVVVVVVPPPARSALPCDDHGLCPASRAAVQLERTYTEAGPAVLDRLFEVLDSDGSKTLSYKVCACVVGRRRAAWCLVRRAW